MQTDEIVKLTRKELHNLIVSQGEAERYKFTGRDRRMNPRCMFPAMVEVWPANGDGTEHWLGICQNLSMNGLGMVCDCSFEPDTAIEISVHLFEASIYGKAFVRHCTKTPRGYLIGVEFNFDE
jgi:hypothetical protein